MAEVSFLTSTIQQQLPPIRSKARKSQKQIGKFGALTTKDVNRCITKWKEKDHEAGVRKAGKAPRSLISTKSATEEAESAGTSSRVPVAPEYQFHTCYL